MKHISTYISTYFSPKQDSIKFHQYWSFNYAQPISKISWVYSLETMETMHLGYWDINWDFRFSLKKRKLWYFSLLMVLWFHVKNQKNGKGKNPLETLNSAYQAISDPFWIDLRCKEKKSKKSVCPAPEYALLCHYYRKDTLALFLGSFSLTLVTKIFPYS